jgi:glycosyltransferase involved in cell wall biosynthesis
MHYKGTPRYEKVNGFNIYRTAALRGKPNICYPHELATYVPGAFFKTLKLCRQEKYDIIHCHFLVPGAPLAYLINKITKIPFIVTCHGSDVPGHNPDRFKLLHKAIKPFWKFLAKRIPTITTPSESLKAKILISSPNANVEVIPNGIDTDKFGKAAKSKSILLCSRIFHFKGFQYFINAVKDISLDWQINIIGDGPYLSELKRIARGSKTPIKFWGWLDQNGNDYRELFEKSMIFVFPSEMENFPSVLLDAMSCGMAIITSSTGGCPEVVGDAAMLVEPKNTEAIRNCLEKLVNCEQTRLQLASAAIERVKNFGWTQIVQEYLKCYLRKQQ